MILLLLTAQIAFAQDAPVLRTSVRARAMQPGEVVRLDVSCRCGGEQPAASAFGQDIPLFAAGGGRWRGLIGIDLDTTPGAYEVTVRLDRADRSPIVSTRPLQIIPKRFRTRRLRVDPSFVEPPADVLERIEREAELMQTLFDTNTPVKWNGAFRLPVKQPAVSNFGVRSVFNGQLRNPHAGVDFGSPAKTPIASPGAGQVVLAERLYFTGNTVIVDHGQGLLSLFAHLSRIDVRKDDSVARGDIIGLVGATGRVTGPHLHWSVRLRGARVDPLSLIAAVRGIQDTNHAAKNTKNTKNTKKKK